jgi:L-ascorbate metabolism protein UlaG (beta-lactamase superfamily)
MLTLRRLIALIASIIPALAHAQSREANADSVTITYLANEGVMVSSGDRKVLIDGLFLKYKTGFALPADSTQRALAQARPPFDGVDLVLATHQHGDHFEPIPVAAHLHANPGASFLAAAQVIDSLRRYAPALDLPPARLLPRTTREHTRRRDIVNGIVVEQLGIPHGGGWRSRGLEHVAYIVELGGRRVLHVGDASLTDDVLASFRLDTARIDVALLPAWLLTNDKERAAVERWIKPRYVIGFHVGEGDEERAAAAIRAVMPRAITFTRSLEQRRF